jgi:hypothetical protein
MPERLHREQTRRVEHRLVGSKQGTSSRRRTCGMKPGISSAMLAATRSLVGCQPDVVIQ